MVMKKGQAALDFLMTYGWAIALVVIVAAALFALGVFDVSNFIGTKAAGFAGVTVSAWQMTTGGTLTMKLSNQVGQRVNITGVGVTVGTSSATVNGTVGFLNTGDTTSTLTTAANALGTQSGYTAKVVINYTDSSGFQSSSTGTLTGKAV